MKRAISFACLIATFAVTQLHAGERAGEEHEFVAPPPVRQIPRPRVAPEPGVEPERRVAQTPSIEAREAQQQRETAAAANKEWAERPRPDDEQQLLREDRELQERTIKEGEQQQAQKRAEQEQAKKQRLSFAEARERMTRERHDRAWWSERYNRILRAGTGFYVFDEGYWYPAFGYDAEADVYAYDGPIYASGNMTPDQEVAAVQEKLEADGYYDGSPTGVLDTATQQAIAKFQANNDLVATGAIDEPTAEALGLA